MYLLGVVNGNTLQPSDINLMTVALKWVRLAGSLLGARNCSGQDPIVPGLPSTGLPSEEIVRADIGDSERMSFLRRLQPERHAESAADPDALLVVWSRQNPQAFTRLYDRYFPAVYGYCLSQLRDPEAAEDAASQTFLQALAALPGYHETGRFRSWLFVIAHNAVLDLISGRRTGVPLDAAMNVLDPAESPEDRAIAALDRVWLDGAIGRLPDDDRQVLELRRAGLTGREIAHVLGIGHEAAKKRQLRAIGRIRAELGGLPGDQEVTSWRLTITSALMPWIAIGTPCRGQTPARPRTWIETSPRRSIAQLGAPVPPSHLAGARQRVRQRILGLATAATMHGGSRPGLRATIPALS